MIFGYFLTAFFGPRGFADIILPAYLQAAAGLRVAPFTVAAAAAVDK